MAAQCVGGSCKREIEDRELINKCAKTAWNLITHSSGGENLISHIAGPDRLCVQGVILEPTKYLDQFCVQGVFLEPTKYLDRLCVQGVILAPTK